MDASEILEKLMKWLSDPRGRETLRTIVYLVLPIVLLIGLRSAARRKSPEKSSRVIKPKVRPSTHESPRVTESLKETRAREQKKIEKELQEVFGRKDSVLARAKKEFNRSGRQESSRAKSPETNEKKMLQEELLKLFTRRPK